MQPFASFFDDAAIFPPGNASMDVAVPQHEDYANAWFADLVGPFVITDTRLAEAQTELANHVGQTLDVSVIPTGGVASISPVLDSVAGDPRLSLSSVEVPVLKADDVIAAAASVHELCGAVPNYVEIGWSADWDAAAERITGTSSRLKIRTGGTTADAFPTSEQLAEAIIAAIRHGVPFKCTAGLHQGIRHIDDQGFAHHGFLNILLATLSDNETDIVSTLNRDDHRIVEEFVSLSDYDIGLARSRFVSFGTCSVVEPIEDLIHHGLLKEN